MSVPVMVALVVFIEAFLHYFPWRLVLGGRELPRVPAYTLGVLGMLVPYATWMIEHGLVEEAISLGLVVVGAGAAVAWCYAVDWVLSQWWRRLEAEERERVYAGQQGPDTPARGA
jgi:hypothetical protein